MKRRTLSIAKSFIALTALVALLGLSGVLCAANKVAPAQPVDVNVASVEQLMAIPGIGASKAQAIVEYRKVKPFASAQELTNVKGIGDKMLAKIAPYVSASGNGAKQPGTAERATR